MPATFSYAPNIQHFSTEAQQFISRITNPGLTQKTRLALFIDTIVAGGLWPKTKAMWIMAQDIAANGYVNLKSSSYTLIPSSPAPTFTAYRGFTGGTNKSFDTQINPSTDQSIYLQDDSSMGVRTNIDMQEDNYAMGSNNAVPSSLFLYTRLATGGEAGKMKACLFDGAGDTEGVTVANSVGMTIAVRTGTGATQDYREKTQIGTNTHTSGLPPNRTILLLASRDLSGDPTLFSSNQQSFAFFGSKFLQADVNCLVDAWNAYQGSLP